MGVPGGPLARRITVMRDQQGKAEVEEQHAAHFRNWIEQVGGRVLGPWTGRDGDPGIRVDFQFDQEEPGLALEITTIANEASEALQHELAKLETRLDSVAKEEQLGCWIVAIREGTLLVPLRDALPRFMRSQATSTIPACYWTDEAPADATHEELKDLVDLLRLGVFRLDRVDGDDGVVVWPPIRDKSFVSGFGTLLRFAVSDNAAKLGETRPRETHLLVHVGIPVSADPSLTPPPSLPEEIDVLWVHLGYWNAKYDYRVWQTTRELGSWQRLGHPMGEPPASPG